MANKKRHKSSSRWPQLLIIGGVIMLALVILALKGQSQPEAPASSSALPQAQLERALSAGKPVLAFFHSNNCEQCLIMIERVEQVFPEFVDSIELVDVNVYDPKNEPLLRKVRLQYIPTLVFYDQSGHAQTYVGAMETSALRQRLNVLAGAQ